MESGQRRLDRKVVHHGHMLDLCEDELLLPDGRHVFYDHVEHKAAAAVLPVLQDGRIVLVRQYRNSLDSYLLEIPAGGLDFPEEPTKEAALRELEEETGYRCSEAELLLEFLTAVAFCNEKIDIYLAGNLTKTRQKLDQDEFIDVCVYTLEELTDMIYSGQIQDSKTIAAVLAYKDRYLRQNELQA